MAHFVKFYFLRRERMTCVLKFTNMTTGRHPDVMCD